MHLFEIIRRQAIKANEGEGGGGNDARGAIVDCYPIKLSTKLTSFEQLNLRLFYSYVSMSFHCINTMIVVGGCSKQCKTNQGRFFFLKPIRIFQLTVTDAFTV